MHKLNPFHLLMLFAFTGCQDDIAPLEPRRTASLAELAVEIHDTPRSFLLSDKRGGFLVGNVNRPAGSYTHTWTIRDRTIALNPVLSVGNNALTVERLHSLRVFPHHVQAIYTDTSTLTIGTLELDRNDIHALTFQVNPAAAGAVGCSISPGKAWVLQSNQTNELLFTNMNSGDMLYVLGGEAAAIERERITLPPGSENVFVVFHCRQGVSVDTLRRIAARHRELREHREKRMEALLNTSYSAVSDEKLTRALRWSKLMIDALTIEIDKLAPPWHETRTVAVAGIPWDGSIAPRDIAIALLGIDLALGTYGPATSMIRVLAGLQDTIPRSPTYGRIAEVASSSRRAFTAVDVAPWLITRMYDHITVTNDTALARELYPVIRRAYEGARRRNVDSLNLLTHGTNETWMKVPRGNRAAETQLLWFFQQLISSFVASYAGDTADARLWRERAHATVANFNSLFVDTTRNLVVDHLQANNTQSTALRPGPLYCLELIDEERVRHGTISTIVPALVSRDGVHTLDNGLKWTWLNGQVTYALTRYDRQDLAYEITSRMAHHILDQGVVGGLPAAITATGAGHNSVSLAGMAEYVRSFYQDYLGVRIDGTSRRIALQPKLPDSLWSADVTVYAGTHPVHIRYARTSDLSRITVDSPELPEPWTLGFLWMMPTGNAWRGAGTLTGGAPLTLVVGEDDVVVYEGNRQSTLTSKQKLTGFSLREGMDVHLAGTAGE
jgi:hypothetical protein